MSLGHALEDLESIGTKFFMNGPIVRQITRGGKSEIETEIETEIDH